MSNHSPSPNIYIINRSAHDYSDAERFGTPVYLSSGSINRFATNKMVRLFSPILEASEPNDYILITGLTIMSSIAVGMFVYRHGHVNLLLHRSDHTYIERRLRFDEMISSSWKDVIKETENDREK